MADYDLIIKGGTVATATDTFKADIGIRDGRIAALGLGLEGAARTLDATGKLVLPGGIETHCHIEQESATGAMTSDDYYSGSVSAAFGGNSTIVPFAAQHRGQTIADVIRTYDDRAAPKSVLDYSYHLIVSDPTETVLNEELPMAFDRGITSFKVFMTYDKLIVSDEAMLDILVTAKENGALTMVHAENNALIKWMVQRLIARGYDAPKYHAVSHPAASEAEAIQRGIALASFVEAPLLFVHGFHRCRSPRHCGCAHERPHDFRRNLSSIHVPHRRRPRPARGGRGEILLLAAAQGQGHTGCPVAPPECRNVAALFLGPRPLPLR